VYPNSPPLLQINIQVLQDIDGRKRWGIKFRAQLSKKLEKS
jgi:hypothetical protein